MDNYLFPLPNRSTRIGFHYFPDSLHYREIDLATWLPELRKLGASWLVINSPVDRAIPETFITGLLQAGIEPILQFNLTLPFPPPPSEIRTIFEAYARWGARMVVLFDRPNSRTAWSSSGWIQQNLVERFLDHYVPLANIAHQSGLLSVFPPLEPGGNYWDLAFLRTALESLQRRHQNFVLDNLVLSAYAWTHDHSLNWGAGGPERWPEARPYYTPQGSQDHRGYRIFDWYQAQTKAVLQQTSPVILFQSGFPGDPFSTELRIGDPDKLADNYIDMAHLLKDETVNDKANSVEELESLPSYILASNYWQLVDSKAGNAISPHSWYLPEGNPTPVANKFIAILKNTQSANAEKGNETEAVDSTVSDHPISHYLLLPTFKGSVTDWHLNLIHPFIKKFLPTVGFSLDEAAMAERVTVIGDELTFSEEALNNLRQTGSLVDRISGNGTNIATLLLER